MKRLLLLILALTSLAYAGPQRILFMRQGPSSSAVFVSNADGTGERPLLQSKNMDYDAVWSPDGQWIVFTSERDGSAELYRIKANGTRLERLTDNSVYDDQASFSPNSKRIVFVSTRSGGRANLWIMDLQTNRATPLTSGAGGDFRPAWSPDGKWIAFSSDRESSLPREKRRTMVGTPATGRRLSHTSGRLRTQTCKRTWQLLWQPKVVGRQQTGNRILHVCGRELYLSS